MYLDIISKKPRSLVLFFSFFAFFLGKIIGLWHESIGDNFIANNMEFLKDVHIPFFVPMFLPSIMAAVFVFVVYKIAERLFGVKEGVFSAIIAGGNVVSLLVFTKMSIEILYAIPMTLLIGIVVVLYAKEEIRIKHQTIWFYICLTVAFMIRDLLTGIILFSLFMMLLKSVNFDTKRFKSLVNIYGITFGFLTVMAYYVFIKTSYTFNVDMFKIRLLFQNKDIFDFVFAFLPFNFFIIPSIPFFKTLVKNAEFKGLFVWLITAVVYIAMAVVETDSRFGRFLLVIPPISILLGVCISNMGLNFNKYLKINFALMIVLSIVLSMMGIAFSIKSENNYQVYAGYIIVFLSLVALFNGGFNIVKKRYYQAFSLFSFTYLLMGIIFSSFFL